MLFLGLLIAFSLPRNTQPLDHQGFEVAFCAQVIQVLQIAQHALASAKSLSRWLPVVCGRKYTWLPFIAAAQAWHCASN